MTFSHLNILNGSKGVLDLLFTEAGICLSPTDVRILTHLSTLHHSSQFTTIRQQVRTNQQMTRDGLDRLINQDLAVREDSRYSITVHGWATLKKVDDLLGQLAHKPAS